MHKYDNSNNIGRKSTRFGNEKGDMEKKNKEIGRIKQI